MYQPLILQRLSKIVLPQITTEDNLIMINCTFHWGYVFFWVPLFWRTSPPKTQFSSQLLFSPFGRVLKYPSKGQSPKLEVRWRAAMYFWPIWMDRRPLELWHKRRSTIWALDPMSCCCQEIPYYQVISLGTKKRRAPPFYLLGRVKKSCDARRKVRRCLKALVVGLTVNPTTLRALKGTPFSP